MAYRLGLRQRIDVRRELADREPGISGQPRQCVLTRGVVVGHARLASRSRGLCRLRATTQALRDKRRPARSLLMDPLFQTFSRHSYATALVYGDSVLILGY